MQDTPNQVVTRVHLQNSLNKKALLPNTQYLERFSRMVLLIEEIDVDGYGRSMVSNTTLPESVG